jgi:hypothetical protein
MRLSTLYHQRRKECVFEHALQALVGLRGARTGARHWDITPAEGLGLFVQYKYKREFLDNHQ